MALRKASPGEGGEKRRVHFGYVKTPAGRSWPAWIAGDCYWCVAHTTGHSKPCLHWMTAGALSCPRCATLKPPETIGYQPLYRDIDGRPVFVIVHEYSREQIDALRFRQLVNVGRGTDAADAVWIKPHEGKPTWYHSTLPERQHPADITETLLSVWNVPELTRWYREQPRDGEQVPKHGTAVKANGEPYAPHMQAAAKRWGADVIPDDQPAEVFDVLKDHIKARMANVEASKNGSHKPKPKG